MLNVHATLISLNGKGILITGKSGAGKSDLALRMIMEQKAVLVADDRVNLTATNNTLYGCAPKELQGKLEIRNVGIGIFNTIEQEKISLIVELTERNELERLPFPEVESFLEVIIPKLRLCAFEHSAIYKIIAKISGIIS